DDRSRGIVKFKAQGDTPLGIGRILMIGIALQPHRPQPIDIGMMKPENWVQCGCVEPSHIAIHRHMNGAMRGVIDLSHGSRPWMMKCGRRPAKSSAYHRNDKIVLSEAVQTGLERIRRYRSPEVSPQSRLI